MEELFPKLTVYDILRYILAYGCWLITAMISMLTLLVMRNVLNVVWPVLGGSRWVLRPVDRFGLVFLGLVWLVYVIFVEQHYRSSITIVRERRVRARIGSTAQAMAARQGKGTRFLRKLGLDVLLQRFVLTATIPLVLLALAYLIQEAVLTLWTR